ncbi:MAG: HIT family protein [Verrucomicrobia bacterium]|nr:HIT family protein [Verrucomicrobiota bacterium]
MIREADATVAGFNVGINSGEAAGQTVMHCHIHLIPRRTGDHPNPRGGDFFGSEDRYVWSQSAGPTDLRR